jgi:hypothetical protein
MTMSRTSSPLLLRMAHSEPGNPAARHEVGGAAREEAPRVAGDRDERRRLQDRETDGQVARVLRELRRAGLALFLQGLEPRDHHGQQLDDDARRDVRHDPQREDRQLQERASAEEVDEREAAGRVRALDAAADVGVAHPGQRDEGPEPEDGHDGQGEQQLAPQVRRSERPGERG